MDYFKSFLRFILEWIGYILLVGIVSKEYDRLGLIQSQLLNFIVKSGVVFVVVNFLLYVTHGRSCEFKYFYGLFCKKILKQD
jgi:hypothetical protein